MSIADTPDPRACSHKNPCGRICSIPATHHGFAETNISPEERVSSLMACPHHASILEPLCFSTHPIGPECGMPGTTFRWEPSDPEIPSWCEWCDLPLDDELKRR